MCSGRSRASLHPPGRRRISWDEVRTMGEHIPSSATWREDSGKGLLWAGGCEPRPEQQLCSSRKPERAPAGRGEELALYPAPHPTLHPFHDSQGKDQACPPASPPIPGSPHCSHLSKYIEFCSYSSSHLPKYIEFCTFCCSHLSKVH